ncbi:hypothetical protein Tco_0471776 [Tanacetum coccineum]
MHQRPYVLYNIKQRDGESTKDFIQRYNSESGNVEGAGMHENLRIRARNHNPELIKREVGHNTDECNHLRKQIEDMLKAGKLSHLIKELKQNSGKDLQKKKGEPHGKEKPQAILMIQP